MDTLVLQLDTEDLLGLQALVELHEVQGEVNANALEEYAAVVLKHGVADRLRAASLPWAPTSEQVDARIQSLKAQAVAGESIENRSGDAASVRGERVTTTTVGGLLPSSLFRRLGLSAFITAALVVMFGGYIGKWSWTGFADNDQLWDWLHLLLLPVALGTFPLWLRYAEHMSRTRKLVLLGLILAFGGFVAAGYLVPLPWTGFSGNKLWDWLTLILLPLIVTTIKAWPKSPREIQRGHVTVFGVICAGWLATLVGGYAANWAWTGYQGNTLWDWLGLLLAPLALTTVLVPAASRWLTGDVESRAKERARERDHETSILNSASVSTGQLQTSASDST